MSAEDLEKYETEMELQLYREYRDIVRQFSYVVETERRFYLANQVDLHVRNSDGEVYFEVEMHDAWVWDMYRPARFAPAAATGYRWPLDGRPAVVRAFAPPPRPWLPGHRGVDLGAAPGTIVRAAGAGTVSFAGRVAGRGVVSVAHPGGLRTTYEP